MRAIAILQALLPALFLWGCAPDPKVEKLPPVEGAAGEVVVIRPASWIGEEVGFVINVDGRDIYTLEMKQHIRARLAAGEHRIAVRCFQILSNDWKENALTQQVQAGGTVYFVVEPAGSCASLKVLPEGEGKRLAARTALRPL